MNLPSSLWSLGLVVLLGATPGLAHADPYAEVFERSAVEEKAGRYDAALAILRSAEAQYPEDYALSLQIGWIAFRAERWDEAEAAYARASSLSKGAYDARLGLAWTRAKKGQCDQADFVALAKERPEDARVKDGVAFCAPKAIVAPLYTAWGSGTFLLLRNARAYGGAAGLVVTPGPWLFAGAYRGTYFPATGGRFRQTSDSSAQHEGYATLGYGSKLAGVSAHYGYLSGSASAQQIGATARWSPFGDVLLGWASSYWDDATIHRFELGWRLPLSQSLSVKPAGSMQLLDGATRYAGHLTLLGDHGGFGWWLGGKYGSESRPVQFAQAITWNYAGDIVAGATAGVRGTWGGTSLSLGYDFALTNRSTGVGSGSFGASSLNHLITLGVAFAGGKS